MGPFSFRQTDGLRKPLPKVVGHTADDPGGDEPDSQEPLETPGSAKIRQEWPACRSRLRARVRRREDEDFFVPRIFLLEFARTAWTRPKATSHLEGLSGVVRVIAVVVPSDDAQRLSLTHERHVHTCGAAAS
jgi:hypothetical protein